MADQAASRTGGFERNCLKEKILNDVKGKAGAPAAAGWPGVTVQQRRGSQMLHLSAMSLSWSFILSRGC